MKAKTKLLRNSPEEEAAIKHGIDTDPDTYELTEAELAGMAPDAQVMKRARGRPKQDTTKQRVTLRLDADVVSGFQSNGHGWQTRINDALRKVLGLRP